MKPFTLEWWMNIINNIDARMSNCRLARDTAFGILNSDDHYARLYQKYYRIRKWVVKRIIEKYGE